MLCFRFAKDNNFFELTDLHILHFFDKLFNFYSLNPSINYLFKADTKGAPIYPLLTQAYFATSSVTDFEQKIGIWIHII